MFVSVGVCVLLLFVLLCRCVSCGLVVFVVVGKCLVLLVSVFLCVCVFLLFR